MNTPTPPSSETMALEQAIATISAMAYAKDAKGVIDAWEVIKACLSAERREREGYRWVPELRECIWTDDGDEYGSYSTSCGNAFFFTDGTPEDNSCKFCCYCGGKLTIAAPDGDAR